MLILGINTTDKNIGIAITDNQSILTEKVIENEKSENLLHHLNKIFSELNLSPNNLNAISVITGPGNYTAVRTGVVIAKTLAQVLEIPIFGVNKLTAMINSFGLENKLICPLIDVKRNEVYFCLAKNINNTLKYQVKEQIIKIKDLESFLESTKDPLIILAKDFKEKTSFFSNTFKNTSFKIDYNFSIKNYMINFIALDKIKNKEISYFNNINPFYIRSAI